MMNDTDILLLDLEAAEQEARDILTKEGVDPDKVVRQLFFAWPQTKVSFGIIGNVSPKLSDFGETAHYAYRMLGVCMLIREALVECKDDDERRRMTYILNLGQFREISATGLNVPEARKFFAKELSGKGGKARTGKDGPVKKLIKTIIKELQEKEQPVNNATIKGKLKDAKYLRKLSDSFMDIRLDIEEQTLSFGIPTDRGEEFHVIKISTLNKVISQQLKPK